MPLSYQLGVALSVASLASCVPPTSVERTFSIVFVVESDPGVRIGAASVFIDGDHVGQSDSNGLVRTTVHGESGRRLRIEHDCPDGHEAPSARKTLRLREYEALGSSERVAMEITLRCVPTERLAAFVIRAKNGADLPVLLNGEEVARTNSSGVAHFSVRSVPGADYKVELDARGRPSVLPSLPMPLFTQPDADDIFILNQSFEVRSEPRSRGPRRARITKIE
ncbi:MAG: hypothetical protein E4H00_04460 [Myxococcales bacterium]|nr:MAG: hypothetical protein E4H00_04460 [Myxococcales bacterium]